MDRKRLVEIIAKAISDTTGIVAQPGDPGLIEISENVADLIGPELGADLRHANMVNMDLSGMDLSRADLRCADLTGANLSHADLSRANLAGAKMAHPDVAAKESRGGGGLSSLILSNEVVDVLAEAGVIPDSRLVRRVVIDLEMGCQPAVHVEMIGDRQLLKVAGPLTGAVVTRADAD